MRKWGFILKEKEISPSEKTKKRERGRGKDGQGGCRGGGMGQQSKKVRECMGPTEKKRGRETGKIRETKQKKGPPSKGEKDGVQTGPEEEKANERTSEESGER